MKPVSKLDLKLSIEAGVISTSIKQSDPVTPSAKRQSSVKRLNSGIKLHRVKDRFAENSIVNEIEPWQETDSDRSDLDVFNREQSPRKLPRISEY